MEFQLDMFIAQLINFAILFWLYKKFLAKSMVKQIEERRGLIKKLENADKEYETLINKAKSEAKAIMQKGIEKKNQIIAEAGAVAESQQKEILEKAHRQAEQAIKNAELKAANLENELTNNFEQGVKQTTQRVVRKLLKDDKQLQDAYVQSLIQEASQNQ